MDTFDSKDLNETKFLVFNFINLLTPAETISTAAVTSTVESGTDSSPSSMIDGSASISGTRRITVNNWWSRWSCL